MELETLKLLLFWHHFSAKLKYLQCTVVSCRHHRSLKIFLKIKFHSTHKSFVSQCRYSSTTQSGTLYNFCFIFHFKVFNLEIPVILPQFLPHSTLIFMYNWGKPLYFTGSLYILPKPNALWPWCAETLQPVWTTKISWDLYEPLTKFKIHLLTPLYLSLHYLKKYFIWNTTCPFLRLWKQLWYCIYHSTLILIA